MHKIWEKFQRDYLDKEGLAVVLKLIANSAAELGSDFNEALKAAIAAEKERADAADEKLRGEVTKKLTIKGSSDDGSDDLSYNGTEDKDLIATFTHELGTGTDADKKFLVLKLGFKGTGDEFNNKLREVARFDTSEFTKDAFLKDVEITDNEKGEKVLRFTFTIEVKGEEPEEPTKTVDVPLTDIFSGNAADVSVEVYEAANISISDDDNVQTVLNKLVQFSSDLADKVKSNEEDILEIQNEINRFKPISIAEIYKMYYGSDAAEKFDTLVENLESNGISNIEEDVYVSGDSLKLENLSNKEIDMNGNQIVADGSSYGDTVTIKDSNVTIKNAKIYSPEEVQPSGAVIIVEGNSNVTLENVTAVGNYPVYVYGNDAQVTIKSGNYIANMIGAEAIYVEKASTLPAVIIEDGHFEGLPDANGKMFVLNIKDSLRKEKNITPATAYTMIEVRGGEFVNFNPANNGAEGEGTCFVPSGYTVEETKAGKNTIYTVKPE